MGWFSGEKKSGGGNDNTSPGYDKARENFEKGKPEIDTRRDMDRQRREERIKPVEPKK